MINGSLECRRTKEASAETFIKHVVSKFNGFYFEKIFVFHNEMKIVFFHIIILYIKFSERPKEKKMKALYYKRL